MRRPPEELAKTAILDVRDEVTARRWLRARVFHPHTPWRKAMPFEVAAKRAATCLPFCYHAHAGGGGRRLHQGLDQYRVLPVHG